MRTPLLLAVLLLAPVLVPAVSGAQSWSTQRSDDELEYRFELLEGEIRALRRELGVARGAAAGGAAGSGSTPDMLRRLSEIEAELRRLTGEVERLKFRVDQIAEDAGRRFGDIEFRLTELEGGDLAALPANPPPLGGGLESGGQGGGVVPQVSVSEQRALDEGIRLVQQGRFGEAEAALRGFLDDYPGSPLVPLAHFWRGEAAFTQGSFQTAARAFLAGYRADQGGEQAPDNLVKLGVSLSRLGQINEACLTFAEVSRRFPRAERAVSEAASEAGRLACGG
ncbi:MAG: tol-pal system protein YbgF [Pseudomonadota bacterium]